VHRVSYTVQSIEKEAKNILNAHPDSRVYIFEGSLGAGKTTLIKELAKQLGVTEQVTSPTFTYLQIYLMKGGGKLYHFDLYRINSLEDFLYAGFDEYLYRPNSIVFIEWPEHIKSLLVYGYCSVHIEYGDENSRNLHYKAQNKTK